jgi:hypothetical protein
MASKRGRPEVEQGLDLSVVIQSQYERTSAGAVPKAVNAQHATQPALSA